jgi:hypothetical protein
MTRPQTTISPPPRSGQVVVIVPPQDPAPQPGSLKELRVLGNQPHTFALRDPVLTADGGYTVPRAYFTTTAGGAGELRRHLIVTQEFQSGSDQHSSGEGGGVDDGTGTLTFQCFDSAAALNHVARAAHYPRPVGEINVAEVLLWVFLFLPLEHPTLMAVAAVSRAWRAAAAYLPHWCLLPALYRVNEDMRRAYESYLFAKAKVEGAEVITQEEYVGLMRRRWTMKSSLVAMAVKIQTFWFVLIVVGSVAGFVTVALCILTAALG